MAERIREIEYYYTTTPDEPGAGAEVLRKLKEGGVNLLACHAFPEGGRSQIDFVPADAATLRKAAREANIALTGPKKLFLIEGDDRVGVGAELLGKLAKAKINVTALDSVVVGDRYGSLLWVDAEDVAKAGKALGAE